MAISIVLIVESQTDGIVPLAVSVVDIDSGALRGSDLHPRSKRRAPAAELLRPQTPNRSSLGHVIASPEAAQG